MFRWIKLRFRQWIDRRKSKQTIRLDLIDRIQKLRFQTKRFAENGFSTGAYAPTEIHSASLGQQCEMYYGLTETNISVHVWRLMEMVSERRKVRLTALWMSYRTLGYNEIRYGLESDALDDLYRIANEPRPAKPTKVLESYWKAFIRLTR